MMTRHLDRFSLSRLMMGLLLALLTGCQQLTVEARQQLEQGAHAYNMGRYASARTTLNEFIADNQDYPEVAEAHYIRGLAHLKRNMRTEAQRDFEAAIEKSGRHEVTVRAKAALAVMAYDDDNYATAVRYYEDAILWLSDLRDFDDHLLRYGISLQRVGKWEQAAHQFSRILHEHPTGSASKTARYMMSWNRPYFTVQCHALSSAEAARKEVARLRALGLPAEQQLETRHGKALYLIQVGRYKNYNEAQQAAVRIRRVAGVDRAKVVP